MPLPKELLTAADVPYSLALRSPSWPVIGTR